MREPKPPQKTYSMTSFLSASLGKPARGVDDQPSCCQDSNHQPPQARPRSSFRAQTPNHKSHSFSQSYGTNLPTSLAYILPSPEAPHLGDLMRSSVRRRPRVHNCCCAAACSFQGTSPESQGREAVSLPTRKTLPRSSGQSVSARHTRLIRADVSVWVGRHRRTRAYARRRCSRGRTRP